MVDFVFDCERVHAAVARIIRLKLEYNEIEARFHCLRKWRLKTCIKGEIAKVKVWEIKNIESFGVYFFHPGEILCLKSERDFAIFYLFRRQSKSFELQNCRRADLFP